MLAQLVGHVRVFGQQLPLRLRLAPGQPPEVAVDDLPYASIAGVVRFCPGVRHTPPLVPVVEIPMDISILKSELVLTTRIRQACNYL
jgi:hypothetical protein